ncbi:STAS domain-containing protein [Streptomyces sp. NBC_01210]|uniref:STAS domain-containing protein n=1 Tax=Streptomyces sp. NBC_01210 TaxID=2903774 RepID=UPI002E13D870|nr:STAS domain-containing protein [Streptomyces sp. NBC_01210]
MASRSGLSKKPDPRPVRPTFSNRLALTVTGVAGGRARVVAAGEIDLDSAPDLHRVLDAALQASTGLEIDLARVSFCDCSGLQVLIDIRHKALSSGQTAAVIDTSPCVWRLFDLTGTLDVLAATTRAGADSDPLPPLRGETAISESGG